MNRPIVWLALAYVAGIGAANYGLLPGIHGPLLLLGLGFALALAGFGRSRMLAPLICFCAVGALLFGVRHAGPRGDDLAQFALGNRGEVVILEGSVRRPALYPDFDARIMSEQAETESAGEPAYTPFILDGAYLTADGETRPIQGRCYVRWSNADRPLFSGQQVQVTGHLDPTLGTVNFGIQSLEDYMRRHGVHSELRVSDSDAVVKTGEADWWWIPYWASRFRDWQAHELADAVPSNCLAFVYTVWLGDRQGIGAELYQRYIESGTAHILAVSGIHMGILFFSVMSLLRLRFTRRTRALIMMGLVVGFAITAGARVSALRAATMIVIYLIGDIFDRDPDAPTSLSLAAILFLTINPDSLFDTGFRLSFLSVASILLFTPVIQDGLSRLRIPERAAQPMGATLGVQILPLPVAVNAFHVLPVLSPIVNLFVIPLLAAALWLCFFTTVGIIVWQPVGMLFGHALLPVVWTIEHIVSLVAASKYSHFILTSPTTFAVIAIIAAAVLAFRNPFAWRFGMRAAVPVGLFAAAIAFWRPWHEDPMVAFLDVRHGDATVVRTDDGAVMLVDGGDASPFVDYGKRVVEPFLLTHGMPRIDIMVATHPDRDHIGGLIHVLEKMDVKKLVLGPRPSGREQEKTLLASAKANAVPVERVMAGDALQLGDTEIEVLHPPHNFSSGDSTNNASLVLAFDWMGQRILLPADVEVEAEAMLSKRDCEADFMKVPHHGSHTSSTLPFLESVEPEVAVVSTGRRPGRVPVHPSVERRYHELGIDLWRTDQAGGIALRVQENGVVLKSAREEREYPWR